MDLVGGPNRGGHPKSSEDVPFIGQLTPLIAPLRFSIVAHPIDISPYSPISIQSIYKGAFPRRRNLPFLSRLRIKTILSLTPKALEILDEEVDNWAKNNAISLIHVKCEKPKDDGGGLSKEAAAKALLHLLDARQLPLYVHCLDGQSVSTLLVGILRRVQAWSTRAIIDEISRSLGHDEEVIQYQTNFVEKFGKPDGVRLPSRRFIPEWTWPDPSPLKRLRDPYDVIVPKEKSNNNERPTTGGSSSTNSHQNVNHKRQASGEGLFSGGAIISAPTFGVGSLPVQHPTLRLRFDPDPELPPPPVFTQPQSSFHSRESSNLFSPSSSRSSSRAGRNNTHGHALHPHHYHSDVRSSSRPSSSQGSPRRRMLTADYSPNLSSNQLDLPVSPPNGQSEFVGSKLAYESKASTLLGDADSTGTRSPNENSTNASSSRRGSIGSSTPTRSSLLSHNATPRASSLVKTIRPVSTRGAVHGLGMNQGLPKVELGEEKDKVRSLSPTDHLSTVQQQNHQLLAESGIRPTILERSVSEAVTAATINNNRASSNNSKSDEEYFSEPEEIERKRREELVYQQENSNSPDHQQGSEDEHNGETQDTDEEEEEEEEDEEEEEEEEDDSEDDEDDGLALEALDLEGY